MRITYRESPDIVHNSTARKKTIKLSPKLIPMYYNTYNQKRLCIRIRDLVS